MAEEIAGLGAVIEALGNRGIEPILVGGLAMVLLNSRRVTQDADLLVPNSASNRAAITEAFYDAGFELGTWIDEYGRISETISRRELAVVRAESDDRSSELFFLNPESLLEIDVLLDFPIPAAEISARAGMVNLGGFALQVAAPEDLLRMKRIALSNRRDSRDVEDIDFLERLLSRK